MPLFKYNFNSATVLQRLGRKGFKRTAASISKLLFTAAILCSAMIAVHETLIETDTAKLLRAENAQLRKHKPELEQQVNEIEQRLTTLKEIDQTLYNKLFNAVPTDHKPKASPLSKEKILLAGISDFQSILRFLNNRSDELVERSSQANADFGSQIKISKAQVETLQSLPTIQPVENIQLDLLVSGFGERINPFHKGKYNHPGVDFAAPRGSAVFATAPGKVITVKKTSLQAGYGNYVEIDHGNGYVTRYAHMDGISVRRGQKVHKGKVIGTIGSSGGSIAPHLHYEVIRDSEPVDPVYFLLEGLTSDQYSALLLQASVQNQSLD